MIYTFPPPLNVGALEISRAYRALGISTFPVKTDGTKQPAFSGWRDYADRLPTDTELHNWHGGSAQHGLGIPGGKASGNLAVLDFETWPSFVAWASRLSAEERAHLGRCPVIGTPRGGAHIYVRLVEPAKGCKLARTPTGACLIEVRGCQHYVVAPGSPPSCHPSGRTWRVLRAGWLDGGPWEPVPLSVWFNLTVLAADLNEYRKPTAREVVGDRVGDATGVRPGDHFNARVGWVDVLSPHGWQVFRSTSSATYWTRPGKGTGVSASTGFCTGPTGGSLFYVFSTSAAPFEAEASYSKFAAYALLHHHGNFTDATRALGRAGYGQQQPRVRVDGKVVRL
jgi:hypothetical protein